MDTNEMAARMGLDQPTALETLNRSDFVTDDDFLNACTEWELSRKSPEYQATRRKLAAQYQEQQEAAERQAQNETFKAIRATVDLDSVTMKQIDQEAAEMARRDLAAGRIFATDFSATQKKYAERLTERAKDSKASGQMFNQMLRRK